ncbi:MAG: hypothetical protein N2C12_00520 [Planctomycetales bacterium]
MMATPDEKNHWESLASDLGAESTDLPEASQEKEPVVPADGAPPEFDSVSASTPMTKPQGSWDDLVSSLGLPETTGKVVADGTGPADETDRSANDDSRQQSQNLPESSGTGEAGSEKKTSPDKSESPDRPRKGRRRRRRGRSTSDEKQNEERAADEVFSGNIENLDAAIDFSSADSDDVGTENGNAGETESSLPEAAASQVSDDSDKDDTEKDDTEKDDTDKDGTRRKRRRRRGRRGGRRQNDDASETVSSDEPAEESDVEDVEDAEDGEDDEASDADSGRRPSHRNIPTWEETVGVIVASNQDARSKSPKSDTGGSRSNRGPRRRSKPHKDESRDKE